MLPRSAFCSLVLIAGLGAVVFGQAPSRADFVRAKRALSSMPLVDGHNDLLRHYFLSDRRKGDIAAYDISKRTPGQTDLPRLKAGMVGAQFLTVAGLDPQHPSRGVLETIDFVYRLAENYPDRLAVVNDAASIRKTAMGGRTAVLLALEGGSPIENSLAVLRAYHRLGVRYMTLTHEGESTEWAPAALCKACRGGLKPFGADVVQEMNRLGMLVDLSHASDEVARDVLRIAKAPVIFSHSSARAIANSPRNVPDDILRAVRSNGGIVMVSFVPYFTTNAYADWYARGEAFNEQLKQKHGSGSEPARSEMAKWDRENPPPRVTVADVANHVEHIRRVAGVGHVGVGSDFDGMFGSIEGLEDVSGFPNLFAELARRGWTDADLRKLAGENFLRVFRRAEIAALPAR